MKRFTKAVIACVSVLALISIAAEPVLAQQQGQRGQRRGGRRFQGRGFAGSSAFLLRSEEVQKDLKLTGEQKEKIEKINADQRAAFAELREIEDQQQRGAKFREIGEKAEKQINAVLNEEQRNRLGQIQLQSSLRFLGTPAVLLQDNVAKDLKITDEQKKSLEKLGTDTRTAMQEAAQNLEGDDLRAVRSDLRKDEGEKAVALLTEAQNKQWKQMLGKPIEIRFNFGGGRGRGARGQDRRRPQPDA